MILKKTICILSLIFTLLFLSGCPGSLSDIIDIKFINNTNYTLIVYCNIREGSDTLLSETTPWPNGIEKTENLLKPHSSQTSRFFESHIRNGTLKGTYNFIFFDADTIKTVPWERIRDEYIVIKRVSIHSMDEFYKYNYVISVP